MGRGGAMHWMDAIIEEVDVNVSPAIEDTERTLTANRTEGPDLVTPALVAGAGSEHVGEDCGDTAAVPAIANYGFEEGRCSINSTFGPFAAVRGHGVTKGWIHDDDVGEGCSGGVGNKVSFDNLGKHVFKLDAGF